MRNWAAFEILIGGVVVVFLTACGGGSMPAPAPLQITLSPSAPSVGVNSSVAIMAQITPALQKNVSTTLWSIAGESQGECTQSPPSSQCPNGTLEWQLLPSGYSVTAVTYFAPSTPGSYQVSVQAQIGDSSNPSKIDYQGSASVTVTVTGQ